MIGPHHLYAMLPGSWAAESTGAGSWSRDAGTPDGLAVLRLEGVLLKPLMQEVSEQLHRLRADSTISEVVIAIDSPGGSLAGTHNLHEAVAALAKEKRVTVAADDLCASAAYYAASAASEFYVNASGGIGSIGVFVAIADTSELLERLGVRMVVIRSGELKGSGFAGTKLSAAQQDALQQSVNE